MSIKKFCELYGRFIMQGSASYAAVRCVKKSPTQSTGDNRRKLTSETKITLSVFDLLQPFNHNIAHLFPRDIVQFFFD